MKRRGAIGVVEIENLSDLAYVLDIMMKSGEIELINVEHIEYGDTSAIIWGDLASVKYTIDVGKEVSNNSNIQMKSYIIPKIHNEALKVVFGFF